MSKIHIKDFLIRNDKQILISFPAMVTKLMNLTEGDTLELHVDMVTQELIIGKKHE